MIKNSSFLKSGATKTAKQANDFYSTIYQKLQLNNLMLGTTINNDKLKQFNLGGSAKLHKGNHKVQ